MDDNEWSLMLTLGLFAYLIGGLMVDVWNGKFQDHGPPRSAFNRYEEEKKRKKAYILRGTSQQMLGNHKEACDDFRRALNLKGNEPDCFHPLHEDVMAYVLKGISQEMLGNYKEASEDFRLALCLKLKSDPRKWASS